MLDRKARKRLAEILGSILDEPRQVEQFEEEIEQLQKQSTDDAILYVADILIQRCIGTGPAAPITGEEWDYYLRLQLLLQSDAECNIEFSRHWSRNQIIPFLLLITYAIVVYPLYLQNIHWIMLNFSLGILSIGIYQLKKSKEDNESQESASYAPFESEDQLHTIRTRISDFHERSYPPRLGKVSFSYRVARLSEIFPRIPLWLLCSPLVLLIQAFPRTRETLTITESTQHRLPDEQQSHSDQL